MFDFRELVKAPQSINLKAIFIYRYVAVEEFPAHYGGFKRDNNSEFSFEDEVHEVTVKASSTGSIEIPAPEVMVLNHNRVFFFPLFLVWFP